MLAGNPADALSFLTRGARLLLQPGLKRFIIVPLFANLLVFIVTTLTLITAFHDLLATLMAWMPSWLEFLAWFLWIFFALFLLFIYGYSFNLITNLIAAPFYGVLSEKIEAQVTGIPLPSEPWSELIPRTLGREITKLWYFLTRGLIILLLIITSWFIPGLNILTLGITTLWAAWCMAVQYADYPADNHQTQFIDLRKKLGRQSITSYSFGGLILCGSTLPVVNIFVTPIAVAGATLYWIEQLKPINAPHGSA